MAELQLSKGYSKYGAQMGRRSQTPSEYVKGKLRLYQVRLDSGGYDNGGAYWGHGEPLWRCMGETEDPEMEIDWFFRASTRHEAKAIVRDSYPEADFFR